jgi:hypothetical protein
VLQHLLDSSCTLGDKFARIVEDHRKWWANSRAGLRNRHRQRGLGDVSPGCRAWMSDGTPVSYVISQLSGIPL